MYEKAILGSAVLFGMTKDLELSVVDIHTNPPTTVTTRLRCVLSGVFVSCSGPNPGLQDILVGADRSLCIPLICVIT